MISLPKPALARPKGAQCCCCGGDGPQRARDRGQRRGPRQQLKNLGLLPKNKAGWRDRIMISNVQEPQGGTAWSVPVPGCHCRQEQVVSSQKKADSGRDVALPGETVVTLPKSETTPMQQPGGRGEGDPPQGHWSSVTPKGTPEGLNTQGRAQSSPWQRGPTRASHPSGHSDASLGRGHQVRGQHLQETFRLKLTAFFAK